MTNTPHAKSATLKAAYRKPQATELNARTTEGGTSGVLEGMMMSATTRKVGGAS